MTIRHINTFAAIVITAVAALPAPLRAETVRVADVVTPLADHSVRLIGCLDDDIRNSVEHWNKGVVPYDKLMDFYRVGRPKFALGEMWAKAIRSGAMLYAYNQDPELRDILRNSVEKVFPLVRSNGALACVPVERQPDGRGGDLWERKYIMLGLSQYYAHVEQDPRVMRLMIAEANSILDQIGDKPKTDIHTQGWTRTGIESFSIMEPLMRVYKLTGDRKYLDFCTYLVQKGGCKGADIFQESIDNVMPRKMGAGYPKAYEMLSVYEGLAEYYRCTGTEKYRTALLNFFENIKRYEITIIGNGGADQPYFPQWRGEAWCNTAIEQANPAIERMMETCAGVTWMKLCSQILRLTGDCSAMDYIERYIYNGLLGAMRPGGDGFSYVNLLNGRKVTDSGWGTQIDGMAVTCCNLSGPMGLAYIPYLAVMQRSEGPVINLYNAARATAKTRAGRDVTLSIDSRFPHDGQVTVTLEKVSAENFTLSLRIPAWSRQTTVKVNGRSVSGVKAGQYLRLTRTWKQGDRVEMALDIRCRLVNAPRSINEDAWARQAVTYGPIVLARDENIDPRYDKPVQIVADRQGEVRVQAVTPTRKTTRMEFLVPTTDGPIHMTDYASVDGWQGKQVCTWMPKKKK